MIRFILPLLLLSSLACFAQHEIPLYSGKVPNSIDTQVKEIKVPHQQVDTLVSKVSVPTLTIFLPPKNMANGTAVIICPGGGYHCLLIEREGKAIARAFNKIGVAAFVLKYRLPDSEMMIDKSIGPLQDAQKAIQIVRKNAVGYQVDPAKIGIMGFSAGGHLAASAGVHFEDKYIDDQGVSLRPDFMILMYPVISLSDSIGHIGSRNYLLGNSPAKDRIRYFSNENHVSAATPPAFITQAYDDEVVSLENSLVFFKKLQQKGISTELHIYSSGKHGYLKEPSFDEWFGRCQNWMQRNTLLTMSSINK